MQYAHCVVSATATAISSLCLTEIAPSLAAASSKSSAWQASVAALMAPADVPVMTWKGLRRGTWQSLAMAQIDGETSPADMLSEREFSVFIQLARGMTVAQIAENLKLSPSTVGTHLYHIKQKLNVQNAAELTLVLDTARAFRAVGERAIKKVPALRGKTVINLFIEPSTRTRSHAIA